MALARAEALRRREEADLQEALRRSRADAAASQPPAPSAPGPHAVQAPRKVSVSRDKDAPTDSWQDMQVRCKYVGSFEVGSGKAPDRVAVKRGIQAMEVSWLTA